MRTREGGEPKEHAFVSGLLPRCGQGTSDLSCQGQEARASVHSPSLVGRGLALRVNTLALAVAPHTSRAHSAAREHSPA